MLHGWPVERGDLAMAFNAQLHANLNRGKGNDPVHAHAFMPLADGPLAPPPKAAEVPKAADWGDGLHALLTVHVEVKT